MNKYRIHFKPFFGGDKIDPLPKNVEGEAMGIVQEGKFIVIGDVREDRVTHKHIFNVDEVVCVETIVEKGE